MKTITTSLSIIFFLAITSLVSAQQKSQTTFVIVHGAWGGSWAFKKVDSLMTAHGALVYRPSLTGQGERVHLASPEVDLTTHINDVVNMIVFEKLSGYRVGWPQLWWHGDHRRGRSRPGKNPKTYLPRCIFTRRWRKCVYG